MSINVDLSWSKFQEFFGDYLVVRRFSSDAQKAIFKHIEKLQFEKLQSESDEPVDFKEVFFSATEKTSAEVYTTNQKAIYSLGGTLLDEALDVTEVAKKMDIPMSEAHPKYDEERTDDSYLEEHYDLLLASQAYLDKAILCINDMLDYPYIKLSNGNWLAFNSINETYAKTEC